MEKKTWEVWLWMKYHQTFSFCKLCFNFIFNQSFPILQPPFSSQKSYCRILSVQSWYLPPASKVWGKVIFSEACVKNSVHGGRGSGPGGDTWWRPPRTATAAGGTHPTGMHSCYFYSELWWSEQLFWIGVVYRTGSLFLRSRIFRRQLQLVWEFIHFSLEPVHTDRTSPQVQSKRP